jgi:hypothetical protein
MKCHQSPAEARHEAQRPEHGRQADQAGTAAQARRRYLQRAGGGLVAAMLGSITREPEIRTRDGEPFMTFSVVADGFRSADELPATVRVEYRGDVDALAVRLVKGASVYCEGRLALSTWTGRDGTDRTGLAINATHVEIILA